MYLLKISITHNKKRIPILNFLIHCISARYIKHETPQILSIKDDCTSLFLNCLTIGFCNSFANCWSGTVSFLTPLA